MKDKEIKFDHFKNIDELLEHIDIWYKEDDIDYTRWFHLEDLKKVKDYITNLQQENKQLKEQNKEKKKRNIEILRRFEACIKLLNKLDFDKYAYSISSLETIKNDLLDILTLGDKENE